MKLIDTKPSTKIYIKYTIASIIWILWMIWASSYLMLIGLPIIFDIYITKKVKWNPFKQNEGEPKKIWKDWADALLYALVVSTIINIFSFQLYAIPTGSLEKTMQIGDHLIVSKLSFGPRLPNTPISFPLVHNTLPLTKSANFYVGWIKWPYKRLCGFGQVERDDLVVFNFPVGDTIMIGYENPDYYEWVRMQGREYIHNNYEIKTRPLDKKENFVKRCNALPGDTLQIIDAKVYRNGILQKAFEGIQHNYLVNTKDEIINPKAFERLGIYKKDVEYNPSTRQYMLPLTDEMVIKLKRVIDVYEQNEYMEKDGQIYIDGKPVTKYTFKQNYYWMMGDNRHKSADSRAWGFVPEDHIVGKPVLVLYSLNEEKNFPSNIRWDRILKSIGKE